MPGGRPPLPTEHLRIHGGLIKGRHDNREGEFKPDGDPIQLIKLEGEALAAWNHFLPRLTGIATELDSHELVAACYWWGEFRKWCNMEDANEYRRLTGMATAYKQFRTIAAKFGLSPTDRVGLKGSGQSADDEFSELIA
jgi:hypothetical protein